MPFGRAPTDRGDRGCPCCRCLEPDAGIRAPELCPYRLNNRLGWGHGGHVPSCPASVQHGLSGRLVPGMREIEILLNLHKRVRLTAPDAQDPGNTDGQISKEK